VIGATVRHFFNLKNAGLMRPGVLVVAAVAFVAVAALNERVRSRPAVAVAVPGYAQVRAIVDRHCLACHSTSPSHRGIAVAPRGAAFDTADDLRRQAAKIYARAVVSTNMPLGNETRMTAEERAQLGAWIKAGAKEK
jgi:uncharacterized membrane protein